MFVLQIRIGDIVIFKEGLVRIRFMLRQYEYRYYEEEEDFLYDFESYDDFDYDVVLVGLQVFLFVYFCFVEFFLMVSQKDFDFVLECFQREDFSFKVILLFLYQ